MDEAMETFSAHAVPEFDGEDLTINIKDVDGIIQKITISLCEDFHALQDNPSEDIFQNSRRILDTGLRAMQAAARQSGKKEGRLGAQQKILLAELNAYLLIQSLLEWSEAVADSDAYLNEDLSKDFHSLQGTQNAKSATMHDMNSGKAAKNSEKLLGNPKFRPALHDQYIFASLLHRDMRLDRSSFLYFECLGLDLDSASVAEDKKIIDKIFRVSFSLIRCGKPNEMRNDPVAFFPSSSDEPGYQIQSRRKLFKKTVGKILAKNCGSAESDDSAQRILLAALAGKMEPLLSVCTRTEDRLWVLANAALEARFDELQGDENVEAGDVPLTVQAIFEEVLPGESWPYFTVYMHLLTGNTEECIKYCSDYASVHSSTVADHLLRFMAHLAVVFRIKDMEHDNELGNRIILLYTGRLHKLSLSHLIPFYTSFLKEQTRVSVLVSTMAALKAERRISFLEALKERSFDCLHICHQVLLRAEEDKKEAEELLDRFAWLLLLKDDALPIAIDEANTLLRQFLEDEDESSARALLEDCADREGDLADRAERILNNEERDPLLLRAINEHRATMLYMAAIEAYAAWKAAKAELAREEVDRRENYDNRSISLLIQNAEKEWHSKKKEELLERRKNNLTIHYQKTVDLLERFVKHQGWKPEKQETPNSVKEEKRLTSLATLRNSLLTRCMLFIIQLHEENHELDMIIEVAALIPFLRLDQDISKRNMRKLLAAIHRAAGKTLS